MSTEEARTREGALTSPVIAATIAAAAMVAQQVVGKATRDALFLSHYPVSRLPLATIAAALASGVVVVAMTRLIQTRGPARALPFALALHAGALLLEWGLAQRFEGAVAIVVYVHTAAVGSTLVSAFWSVVSEGFDPHAAKQAVGRIGAGATLGGVLGGGVAWGASRLTSVPTMFGVMAALSLVCAWSVRAFGHGAAGARTVVAATESRFATMRRTPYLRTLALLVAASAVMQTLLDYSLGAEATAAYGQGPRLLGFFALFQTCVGVTSFLVQLSSNRAVLERLGLGGTMALLPGTVALAGAAALVAPSLATIGLQRATDGVLRASLFRSAYEVLFTPLPQAVKRPTKTTIDVTFDRLGMLAGSGVILGLLAVWPADAGRAVTLATLAVAAVFLMLVQRVRQGYVTTLAEQLRAGTLRLDAAAVVDKTTRNTLSATMDGLDRRTLLAQIEALREAKAKGDGDTPATEPVPEYPDIEASAPDDRVRVLAELRAADIATVRRALAYEPQRLAPLASELLELLGNDALARDAARALESLVPRIVGTIVDAVLDEERPATGRRRAARLLAGVPSQRAAEGLLLGVTSTDAEVRHACGGVLVDMRARAPSLRFDAAPVHALVLRELESLPRGSAETRHLEHAFNLMSLTFPREPVQRAFAALATDDPFLRGVALEYLDAVLPGELRAALALRIDARALVPSPPDSSGPASRDAGALANVLLSTAAAAPRPRRPE